MLRLAVDNPPPRKPRHLRPGFLSASRVRPLGFASPWCAGGGWYLIERADRMRRAYTFRQLERRATIEEIFAGDATPFSQLFDGITACGGGDIFDAAGEALIAACNVIGEVDPDRALCRLPKICTRHRA